VAALERQVAIEPANQRAQRELMDAHARQGRYTDALRQYRTCRDALRRDLDVSPEPRRSAVSILCRRRTADPAPNEPDEESGAVAVASSPSVAATLREAVVRSCMAGPRRAGTRIRSHSPAVVALRRQPSVQAVERLAGASTVQPGRGGRGIRAASLTGNEAG
jgi:hypothetical protein